MERLIGARRIAGTALVLGLVGLGGAAVWRQLSGPTATPVRTAYATARASAGTMVADVFGTASLQPAAQAAITSPASGVLQTVTASEGATVTRGALLARLADPALALRVTRDGLAVQAALRALAQAEGVASSQALASTAARQVALRAPLSGQASGTPPVAGTSVQRGQTLFQIVDPRTLVVQTGLIPYIGGQVRVGDLVRARFHQFAGGVSGRVIAVSHTLGASASGSYGVYATTIELTNPLLLAPGDRCHLSVQVGPSRWLTVPQVATIAGYRRVARVRAPVAGRLLSVSVLPSAAVKTGQVLAVIGGASFRGNIASAAAALRQAEATQRQDAATLSQLTVRSPLTGVVGRVLVHSGQTVASGAAITDVFDSQDMKLTLQVSELQIGQVHIGQPVEITSPGVPGKTFLGRVVAIGTVGHSSTGLATFAVRIVVAHTGLLKPGMTADARIVLATAKHAVMVPIAAVLTHGSHAGVEVLRNGVPQLVAVHLGLVNSRDAQVLSGIRAGATVVTGVVGGASRHAAAKAPQSNGQGHGGGGSGNGKKARG